MNREQMIQKATEALAALPDDDWLTTSDVARTVIDTLLPQITTIDELEALPRQTLLLVTTESGGVATPWWDDDGRGGPVRLWTHDGYAADAEAILDMYPMTVVWQP